MARLTTFFLLLATTSLSLQSAIRLLNSTNSAVMTSFPTTTIVTPASPTSSTPTSTPKKPPSPFCNQEGIPGLIQNYQLDFVRTASVFACQQVCASYGNGIGCMSYMYSRDDNLDLQIPDRQNCALYSIPFEGEGMVFMNPFSAERFSDRGPVFKGSTGCYRPGDQVAGPTDFGPRIFG